MAGIKKVKEKKAEVKTRAPANAGAPAVKPAEKTPGSLDAISQTVDETIKYLQNNLRGLFFDLLKLEFLGTVIVLVGCGLAVLIMSVALLGLIAGGALTKTALNVIVKNMLSAQNIFILMIAAIVAIATALMYMAVNITRNNAVDERAKGGSIKVISQITQNFMPATIYLVIIAAITGILFAIPSLMLISGNTALALGSLLLFAVFGIIWIIFLFIIQFSAWELVVGKKSPAASLGASYDLVKKNVIKTFLFDICTLVVSAICGMALGTVNFAIQMMSAIVSMLNPLLGAIATAAILIVISVIEGAIVGALILPFSYLFWKKLKAGN